MNWKELQIVSNTLPRKMAAEFLQANNVWSGTGACYSYMLGYRPGAYLPTKFRFRTWDQKFDGEEYYMDLKKEFEPVFPSLEMHWKEGMGWMSVDPTVIPSGQLFGILSWCRHLAEDPAHVVGYMLLKEAHPELNFYQKLVGGVYLGKDNNTHGSAINRFCIKHIKGLSFEQVQKSWKQYQSVPFSKARTFSTQLGGIYIPGQRYWLPDPWGKDAYYAMKPPLFVDYSKEVIDNLVKGNN